MTKVVALVDIGYAKFEVPVAFMEQLAQMFAQMSMVASRYDGGGVGYRYWYDATPSDVMSVTILDAAAVLEEEPPKEGAAPVVSKPIKQADSRIVAAPSDEPITIGKVPPMRDFVDEYRDLDEAAL
jgi:hypothetical protein